MVVQLWVVLTLCRQHFRRKVNIRYFLFMLVRHILNINQGLSEQSKAWIVVFPLLILAIVSGLAVWKREQLKELMRRKISKSEKYDYLFL